MDIPYIDDCLCNHASWCEQCVLWDHSPVGEELQATNSFTNDVEHPMIQTLTSQRAENGLCINSALFLQTQTSSIELLRHGSDSSGDGDVPPTAIELHDLHLDLELSDSDKDHPPTNSQTSNPVLEQPPKVCEPTLPLELDPVILLHRLPDALLSDCKPKPTPMGSVAELCISSLEESGSSLASSGHYKCSSDSSTQTDDVIILDPEPKLDTFINATDDSDFIIIPTPGGLTIAPKSTVRLLPFSSSPIGKASSPFNVASPILSFPKSCPINIPRAEITSERRVTGSTLRTCESMADPLPSENETASHLQNTCGKVSNSLIGNSNPSAQESRDDSPTDRVPKCDSSATCTIPQTEDVDVNIEKDSFDFISEKETYCTLPESPGIIQQFLKTVSYDIPPFYKRLTSDDAVMEQRFREHNARVQDFINKSMKKNESRAAVVQTPFIQPPVVLTSGSSPSTSAGHDKDNLLQTELDKNPLIDSSPRDTSQTICLHPVSTTSSLQCHDMLSEEQSDAEIASISPKNSDCSLNGQPPTASLSDWLPSGKTKPLESLHMSLVDEDQSSQFLMKAPGLLHSENPTNEVLPLTELASAEVVKTFINRLDALPQQIRSATLQRCLDISKKNISDLLGPKIMDDGVPCVNDALYNDVWPVNENANSRVLNGTLHSIFPRKNIIPCSSGHCNFIARAGTWAKTISSLVFHTHQVHNEMITSSVDWCSICKSCISGNPIKHRCLIGKPFRPVVTSIKFTCYLCTYMGNSAKALKQHVQAKHIADSVSGSRHLALDKASALKSSFSCRLCPFLSKNTGALWQHMESEHLRDFPECSRFLDVCESSDQKTDLLKPNEPNNPMVKEPCSPAKQTLPNSTEHSLPQECANTSSSVEPALPLGQYITASDCQDATLILSPETEETEILQESRIDQLPRPATRPNFGTILIQDDSIYFLLPLSSTLKCPYSKCSAVFTATSWMARKRSVIRHLRGQRHRKSISRTIYVCSTCSEELDKNPSHHPCLMGRVSQDVTSSTHLFSCSTCTLSFPTQVGLLNHERSHRTASLKRAIRVDQNDSASAKNSAMDGIHATPLLTDEISVERPSQEMNNTPDEDTAITVKDDDPPLTVQYYGTLFDLSRADVNDLSWGSFQETLAQIYAEIAILVKLPEKRDSSSKQQFSKPLDVQNASQVQKMYRRNRRATIRAINKEPKKPIPFSSQTLVQHFQPIFSERTSSDTFFEGITLNPPISLRPFSRNEVKRHLLNAENTSPGQDCVTYSTWRTVDPEATVLTQIINICLRHKKIPDSWKDSLTVLIPKEGVPKSPSDMRPISLLPTAYKILAKCLVKRIRDWAFDNKVISPSQKGFLPFDGVFEHNYILEERVRRAKETGAELCLAWLDISQAFNSLPHSALLHALRAYGAGNDFCQLISNIYSGNATQFFSSNGISPSVPVNCGVRQGCPLSGLLFALTINPLLSRLQSASTDHTVLAFADDLVLLGHSSQHLQELLDITLSGLQDISLTVNFHKCKTLHLSGQTPVGCRPTKFHLSGNELPTLTEEQFHPMLGKPFSIPNLKDLSLLSSYEDLSDSIFNSALAPWQKLEATRDFLFPSLQFALRNNFFRKKEWDLLDRNVKMHAKDTLYFNRSTGPPNYLYGSRKSGCLGFPLLNFDSDAAMVDSAFKLLTSPDPAVKKLALEDLCQVVSHRIGHASSSTDLVNFLSGSNEGRFADTTNKHESVWSNARKASSRLKVTWSFNDQLFPSVTIGHTTITALGRNKILQTLRSLRKDSCTDELHQCPSLGRTMECVAADSSSSHFLYSGDYTKFADWRFVHRARTGLLPLNGCRRGPVPPEMKRCRHCSWGTIENVSHVLHHCMRHSRAYTHRHNAILQRLKNASSKWKIYSMDSIIGSTKLKPDIVLVKGDQALIIDVSIVHDNRMHSFQTAREEKVAKYDPLVSYLRPMFRNIKVDALILGGTGTWDPANNSLLLKLCTRKYLVLLKKLCVSDVISWSRRVYTEHMTDQRQYSDNDICFINPVKPVRLPPRTTTSQQSSVVAQHPVSQQRTTEQRFPVYNPKDRIVAVTLENSCSNDATIPLNESHCSSSVSSLIPSPQTDQTVTKGSSSTAFRDPTASSDSIASISPLDCLVVNEIDPQAPKRKILSSRVLTDPKTSVPSKKLATRQKQRPHSSTEGGPLDYQLGRIRRTHSRTPVTPPRRKTLTSLTSSSSVTTTHVGSLTTTCSQPFCVDERLVNTSSSGIHDTCSQPSCCDTRRVQSSTFMPVSSTTSKTRSGYKSTGFASRTFFNSRLSGSSNTVSNSAALDFSTRPVFSSQWPRTSSARVHRDCIEDDDFATVKRTHTSGGSKKLSSGGRVFTNSKLQKKKVSFASPIATTR